MVDSKKRPGKDLDRIDRNILNELQKDGRISNVELSKRVGLSPTPCLERVRRLPVVQLCRWPVYLCAGGYCGTAQTRGETALGQNGQPVPDGERGGLFCRAGAKPGVGWRLQAKR
jgi:hypothetical protein